MLSPNFGIRRRRESYCFFGVFAFWDFWRASAEESDVIPESDFSGVGCGPLVTSGCSSGCFIFFWLPKFLVNFLNKTFYKIFIFFWKFQIYFYVIKCLQMSYPIRSQNHAKFGCRQSSFQLQENLQISKTLKKVRFFTISRPSCHQIRNK